MIIQHDKEKQKQNEIQYFEPKTAGGCIRTAHIELTRGLKRFESKVCPMCGLEVYPV